MNDAHVFVRSLPSPNPRRLPRIPPGVRRQNLERVPHRGVADHGAFATIFARASASRWTRAHSPSRRGRRRRRTRRATAASSPRSSSSRAPAPTIASSPRPGTPACRSACTSRSNMYPISAASVPLAGAHPNLCGGRKHSALHPVSDERVLRSFCPGTWRTRAMISGSTGAAASRPGTNRARVTAANARAHRGRRQRRRTRPRVRFHQRLQTEPLVARR